MPYTIIRSNGTTLTTIQDGALNTKASSLILVGKGYPDSGLAMNTNFVKLTENFASNVPPAYPLKGQLWYNTTDNTLRIAPTDKITLASQWVILGARGLPGRDGTTLPTSAQGFLRNNGAGDLSWSSLPNATNTIPGVVRVGNNLRIDNTGLLSVTLPTPYALPTASSTVLGGVKIGTNLTIDENGALSASMTAGYSLPTAGATTLGGVKIGSESGLSVTDGNLALTAATQSKLGGVKIGAGLAIDSATGVVTLPPATTMALGGIIVGKNLSIVNGVLNASTITGDGVALPLADSSLVGNFLKLANPEGGLIWSTLPAVTTGELASVTVIGDNLTITDGVLSATTGGGGVQALPDSQTGAARAGEYLQNVNGAGSLAWAPLPKVATGALKSVVSLGDYLSVDAGVLKTTLPARAAGFLKSSSTGVLSWSSSTAVTAGDYEDLTNKPVLSTVATTGKYTDLTDRPPLATVATSGKYTDLGDTPTTFTPPMASGTVLGGIKIGTGLSINSLTGEVTATGGGGSGSYTLPAASTTTLGGVKVDGSTITIASEVIKAATATASSLGVVSIGTGLSVDSAGAATLKIASGTALGGIKIGTGLSIVSSTGVTTVATASASVLGGVKIDDSTIKVNDAGQIYAKVTGGGGTAGFSGTGTPTVSSESNLNLTAAGRVQVTGSPFKLWNVTTTQRDAITASNGDMIYNTTTNKIQGYAAGSWRDLH